MGDTLDLGRLAMGTAPLGGLYGTVTDNDAMAAMQAAVARGITHFDTAPHYGRGLAEGRLGRFLASTYQPERLTVSTKVGRRVRGTSERAADDIFLGAPPGESVFDFTTTGIREELDESRSRIGRDFIDVVLIHDPDDHLDGALVAVDELLAQKQAGRIGAIGVGTNTVAVALHLMDRVELDVVLLAGRITLLDDSGEVVARRCAIDGVSLIAAGVFNSGILADDGNGGRRDDGAAAGAATYDYMPASDSIVSRTDALRQLCSDHGVTLHRAAINFPGRIEGVATTLVGLRSAIEVEAAAAAMDAPPGDDFWADLDSLRSQQLQRQGGSA